ncbi:MAG: TQO small subunit DoxD [Acidimicrobiia bacterium]|nr:TQO small subunit DoxD [Acidimicrobiia bacterium]
MAAVRIALGLLWIYGAGWKRPPDFGESSGTGLYEFSNLAVEHPVFPPFSWAMEQVVIPNIGLFGWGVLVLEATLGAFLVVGLLTRAWALIGAAQSLFIFLSVGAAPIEWPWSYVVMVAAHLAVAATCAGRWFGLDGILRPLWRSSGGRFARVAERLS